MRLPGWVTAGDLVIGIAGGLCLALAAWAWQRWHGAELVAETESYLAEQAARR